MRARTVVPLFALAALAGAAPNLVTAADLKCQARTTHSQPSMEATFEALAGDGLAPFAYEWDFGDGWTSTEQNPTHTYSNPNIYLAVLRVTDSSIPEQTTRDTVRICAGIGCDPTCIASADVRWGEAPLGVQFSAYPVFGPEPEFWTWRFGDGGSATGGQVSHGYSADGTYWAIPTAHAAGGYTYDCFPVRVSALENDVTNVDPGDDGPLRLEAARPNPFRTLAAIGFHLPKAGRVRLSIVDVSGREIAELLDADHPAGPGVGVWQGRAAGGGQAGAGLYFARLEYEGTSRSIRLVRMK